jgi:multiple sugar transport system permease protein
LLFKRYAGLAWMAPAVLYLLLFSIYPLFYSVNVAFTTTTAGRVGFTLANFTRLAHDRLFFISLLQTAIFTLAALAIEFVGGLTLALAADSAARNNWPFLKQARALLLIPMLLPPVVAAVVWRLIYNPDFGVLNGTLKTLGVDTAHLTWIAGESSAMLSVIIVDVWQWTPLMFLLLLAGLQALPVEPFEAALVDGATYWQTLTRVTLPLLRPVIAVAMLLRAMDLLRVFDSIFILTNGGPGFATETASLFIYRTAFRFYDFGYAAVLSFVVLAVTTIMARGLLKVVMGKAA